MIRDLFINSTILISFMFIVNQIVLRCNFDKSFSKKSRAFYGFSGGLLGCLLMFFSVTVAQSTKIDYRFLPIVISSICGGFRSSIISGAIIVIFRLLYFGISKASYLGAISMAITTLGCGIITKLKLSTSRKWTCSTIWSLILAIVTFYMSMNDKRSAGIASLHFITSSTLLSFFLYYIVDYFKTSNALIRKLKEESSKDFLTGLDNVRAFDYALNKHFENAQQKEQTFSLLAIDVDFFKRINDTYGHPVGDMVLKELGKILLHYCRKEDIVSRKGGEEFFIILPGCSINKALKIAERIRSGVNSHIFIIPGDKRTNISISIGISNYPETSSSLNELITQADNALYKAKQFGRNKVCRFPNN